MKRVYAQFAIEFRDLPRMLTEGKPFVGARLLMGVEGMTRGLSPLSVNGGEMVGVGYTRRQALLCLRSDCAILPKTLPHRDDDKALWNLKSGAMAAVNAALEECEGDSGETPEQAWVHAASEAIYRTGGAA